MEYEKIVQAMKQVRKERGITISRLAKAIGISPQSLCYIENNKVPLKLKDYLSICNVLDVTPRELFVGSTIREDRFYTAIQLELLSERDYRLIKDLIMLMTLDKDDL